MRAFMRCCSASVTFIDVAVLRREPLEERDAEATRLRRGGEHRRGELQVVTREHGALGAEQREVQGRFDRLRRLVRDREREPPSGERRGVEPGERREHDVGAIEDLGLGARLERARLREERAGVALLLARGAEAPGAALLAPLRRRTAERDRLLDQAARDARRLVGLGPDLQRVGEHCREHARRMTDPDAREARRGEALDEVVDGEVRGCGGEHLLPSRDRAPDDLHEHGGLAGPGRPVDERDVLRSVRELERRCLLRVEAVRKGRPACGALEPRRLPCEDSVPAPSGRIVPHPREATREPLPRDGRRLELEDHPAVRRPVRRRLVERDRDARSAPARDHAPRRVLPLLPPQRDRDEAADADPGAAERAARACVRDERAARERRLLHRLDVGEGEPARLTLLQIQPPARVLEPGALLLALGREEGG